MKAAAGDERDLDAARGRVDERVAMGVGQPPAAVEQRAVDVDGEQADHQQCGLRRQRPPRGHAHFWGSEVNARTAIFHAVAVADEGELVDAVRLRAAVADDLEIGAQVGEPVAVDGDRDVRERLAERRRVRVFLQRRDPLVAGLKAVGPLAVALRGK